MSAPRNGPATRQGAAEELLASAGVRPTAVRRAVLDCLMRAGAPLSHGELAELPELPALDKVTLYRTLHRLRRARLVHAVQGVDGVWRYCAGAPGSSECPGDHPHFLCESCGRMSCLIGQRLPLVEVPPDVTVRGKQFVVYGQCRECRGRRSGSRRGQGGNPGDSSTASTGRTGRPLGQGFPPEW